MRKVLVVGRDALSREMTASLLADMPIVVQTAASIIDVEKSCRMGCFDLVIMLDLTPLFDGSSSISQLRPEGLRFPKFFVISRQYSEQVVMGLLECGVTQYLTFPVNVLRLRHKIYENLNGSL
ncbi:MAG: response regulator [Alistipes sp.]|nr:response regulator [Alistipes sp.]